MTERDPSDGELATPEAGSAPTAWGERPTAQELDNALLRRDVKARLFGTPAPVMIGRYSISHRLGAGGMGVVYAAEDLQLGRSIALKLVLPGHAGGEARITREARALAKLAHPNVVTIHEVGVHGDEVFVAMELIEGATLRAWLETPRDLAVIAGVFAQAARGLAAAHREGIVHRDFKPDNVLVGDDGRVRVVDFGLAFATDDLPEPELDARPIVPRLSLAGEIIGTPGYMAREQLFGKAIDLRADVFAFCVALYEALHGRLPFAADSMAPLVAAMERGPSALAWRRDLPRGLVKLMRAGLAPDPGDRPASLEPFVAVLARMESPPRRRALVIAAMLAVAGVSVAVHSRFDRPPEQVAPPPAAVESIAVADTDAEPFVCPDEPSGAPVDCAALIDQLLLADDANEDHAARCQFRRACAVPDPQCVPGTQWSGTLGCALPVCEADTLDAMVLQCKTGETACCTAAAYERSSQGVPADVDQRRALASDELARSCGAGDAYACAAFERVLHRRKEPQGSFAARVSACGHGNLQACRRIAILREDRAGVDESCINVAQPGCPPRGLSKPQRERMAECSHVVIETPAMIADDETGPWSEQFASMKLSATEKSTLDRVGDQFRVDERARMTELLLESGGSVAPGEPLSRLRERVFEVLASGHDNGRALQKVADARAGLVPARPDTHDRLNDRAAALLSSAADRLQSAVATELGAKRAEELRRKVWPGSFVESYLGECPP